MLDIQSEDLGNKQNRIVYLTGGSELETAFSEKQQDDLYCLEDQSWWFRYRANVILVLLNRFFEKNRLILDIGGGNGYTTLRVKNSGYDVALIEPSIEACRHAVERGISKVYCGTVDENSIPDESIEQMMLLDVLEHIEDDGAFLKLLYQKATKGGYFVDNCPSL